jgi:glyoxylase-like metal-dependent hydrolase (beta-lactamase superfamily II)
MVRMHHLNCISGCPLGGALMDGRTSSLRARLACHCLLVETGSRLVLVDTGFGLRDVENPASRLSRFFLFLMSPDFRIEMTAFRQFERLGFDPADVTDIVLTHLDFDHAGGLDDFPRATVHMLASERRSAMRQATMLDRMRYRPQQWNTQENWRVYEGSEGDAWFGFQCVRGLAGLPPEILLVPLIGHTFGHAGVAIDTGDRWLMQAGDAYFWHEEMLSEPRCTPGLTFYQWMMEKNRESRLWNQRRLRDLVREHVDDVVVFCGHDPIEFERLAGRDLGELPAPAPRAFVHERPAHVEPRRAAQH